jgi:hypothetical protein
VLLSADFPPAIQTCKLRHLFDRSPYEWRGSMRTSAAISIAFLLSTIACAKQDREGADTAVVSQGAPTSTATSANEPFVLTSADLDGFEKGFAREIELVRAAQERSAKATTAQERGEAIQASFEDRTMADAAPVSGLSPARYIEVRKKLTEILQTLDFQGKIEGPMQMDTARASADMKDRLAGDPYASLDPAGAAALKTRLGRIVPLWARYVNLTAVGG